MRMYTSSTRWVVGISIFRVVDKENNEVFWGRLKKKDVIFQKGSRERIELGKEEDTYYQDQHPVQNEEQWCEQHRQ